MSNKLEVLLQSSIAAPFFLFFLISSGPINIQHSCRDMSKCGGWEKWGEGVTVPRCSACDCWGWTIWTLQRWSHWPGQDKLQILHMQIKIIGMLLIPHLMKWFCFPGLPNQACQACSFCEGTHGFGDSLKACLLWQIPQFSQRLLWAQQGRQRRYSKPQNGLQITAGKLEQWPKSNTLRDLEERVTPLTAGKEKAEGTAALRGRGPANFPFKKSSRMHLSPLKCTLLMVTNILHLSFLSHSTRFKNSFSIDSYLIFLISSSIFPVLVIQFWFLDLWY